MDKAVTRKRNKMRGEKHGRRVDPIARGQIQQLLGETPRKRDLLIEYLHLIQDKFGHISAAHITALASEMNLAPTEVYEVASFYHHFDVIKEEHAAPPALTVRVCDSITCEMFGANRLVEELINENYDDVRSPFEVKQGAAEHRHGRRPGRVPAASDQPSRCRREGKEDLRVRVTRDSPPGPGHHHDR